MQYQVGDCVQKADGVMYVITYVGSVVMLENWGSSLLIFRSELIDWYPVPVTN